MKPWEREYQAKPWENEYVNPSAPAAPAPTKKEKQPIGGGDVVRGALSGATFGWGDELRAVASAALSSAMLGKPYKEQYRAVLDFERQQAKRFRDEHPAAAIAAEVGGGLATGVLGGLKAAGTNLAKNIAARSLATRAAVAGEIGAITGGIAGAGQSEGMENVLPDTLKGAAFGAVTGPLVEIGASGIQAARNTLSPQRGAERLLRRDLTRAGLTVGQVRAKLQKLGPKAALADVDESLRARLESIAAQPGATRPRALRDLTQRTREQIDEILGATGEGQYFEILDTTKKLREKLADPMYQAAFSRGVPHTKNLEDIFNGLEEALPGAWKEAQRLGKLSAVSKGQQIPPLGDARPSLQGWQAVKEYIDDKIGGLLKSGSRKEASYLIEIKKRLMSELDTLNPYYKKARATWAGTKDFETAMESGMEFVNVSRSALKNQWAQMTDVEKLAYKAGVKQKIQDALEKVGFTADATRMFKTPSMMGKLEIIFPDRAERTKLLRTITSSATKQQTYSRVTGGSPTALRQAFREEGSASRDITQAAAEAIGGSPAAMVTSALRRAAASMPFGPNEATRNIAGNMLLEMDPNKIPQVLSALRVGRPMPTTGAGMLPPILLGGAGGLMASE